MADRTGQYLGNYQLLRLLGQGGFAEVYLGEHMRLHTYVAIKVLRAQLQDADAAAFLVEAQTIARLEHPHIVRVLDFDIKEGLPFLVMNYAPGGTLRIRHPGGSVVSLAHVLSYVKELADALQYAHDEKVIHRDIKPENMLLGRRGEVVLSDFGIATLARGSYSIQTQSVAGTIPYMAPEQIQAHPRPASDQYALAVVIYEWLCGTRPFEGTYYELAVKHVSVPPPPLRAAVPTLSARVEQVVLTALAKDPKKRFDSVHTFAKELEQASKEEASFFTQSYPSSPQKINASINQLAQTNEDQRSNRAQSTSQFPKQNRNQELQHLRQEKPLYKSSTHSIQTTTFQNELEPSEASRKKTRFGRRHAIEAILAGSAIVIGSSLAVVAHLIPDQHLFANTQGSSTPRASSITSPPTQQAQVTPTKMPTPIRQTSDTGIVIGTATQPGNTGVSFISPANQNASILIHLPDGEFTAYERACTHEGVQVDYDPQTHMLICPAHGSIFDPASNGRVVQGPAQQQLAMVYVSVNSDGTITTQGFHPVG